MVQKKKQLQLDKETLIIIGMVCLAFLWTADRIFSAKNSTQETDEKPKIEKIKPNENAGKQEEVKKATVPLATGEEPIDKIYDQSGCAACHTIPGIFPARGREGPKLELGTNARRRLEDSNYKGRARTEWEYVQESILNPGAYIVEGYRDHVMPRWYGQKLSAGALDKIIKYLLKIEEVK